MNAKCKKGDKMNAKIGLLLALRDWSEHKLDLLLVLRNWHEQQLLKLTEVHSNNHNSTLQYVFENPLMVEEETIIIASSADNVIRFISNLNKEIVKKYIKKVILNYSISGGTDTGYFEVVKSFAEAIELEESELLDEYQGIFDTWISFNEKNWLK